MPASKPFPANAYPPWLFIPFENTLDHLRRTSACGQTAGKVDPDAVWQFVDKKAIDLYQGTNFQKDAKFGKFSFYNDFESQYNENEGEAFKFLAKIVELYIKRAMELNKEPWRIPAFIWLSELPHGFKEFPGQFTVTIGDERIVYDRKEMIPIGAKTPGSQAMAAYMIETKQWKNYTNSSEPVNPCGKIEKSVQIAPGKFIDAQSITCKFLRKAPGSHVNKEIRIGGLHWPNELSKKALAEQPGFIDELSKVDTKVVGLVGDFNFNVCSQSFVEDTAIATNQRGFLGRTSKNLTSSTNYEYRQYSNSTSTKNFMGFWKTDANNPTYSIGPCKDSVNTTGNFLQLAPCFKLTNEQNPIKGDRTWNKKFPDIDLPEFPRIGESPDTHKDRARSRSRSPRRNLVVSGNNQKTSIEAYDLLYISDHPAIYGWIEDTKK